MSPVVPVPAPAPGTVAAFFDLDNTIIRGASAFHLSLALHRRRFFNARTLARAMVHNLRYNAFGEELDQIDTVRRLALQVVAGHSTAEVTAVGEEVWDEVLSLRVYPGTRAILDGHLDQGHEVWVVTASPLEIGALIARRLGATGALGTVAESVDGIYTGRLVGDMMHGAAKATAVRELAAQRGIDLEASWAYSDSANDLPLLTTTGHAVAINADRRLRIHARAAGWTVHEFRGRRRAARRSGAAVSAAGVAWLGAVVFRALRRPGAVAD